VTSANVMTDDLVNPERGGYRRALPRLSRATVDRLLDILRREHLQVEPVRPELLVASPLGPRITTELARLPIYLARGARSWSGLVVCFPGSKEELTTRFVGTPYLRRILLFSASIFSGSGSRTCFSGSSVCSIKSSPT
jgi:hypothetical protein